MNVLLEKGKSLFVSLHGKYLLCEVTKFQAKLDFSPLSRKFI